MATAPSYTAAEATYCDNHICLNDITEAAADYAEGQRA